MAYALHTDSMSKDATFANPAEHAYGDGITSTAVTEMYNLRKANIDFSITGTRPVLTDLTRPRWKRVVILIFLGWGLDYWSELNINTFWEETVWRIVQRWIAEGKHAGFDDALQDLRCWVDEAKVARETGTRQVMEGEAGEEEVEVGESGAKEEQVNVEKDEEDKAEVEVGKEEPGEEQVEPCIVMPRGCLGARRVPRRSGDGTYKFFARSFKRQTSKGYDAVASEDSDLRREVASLKARALEQEQELRSLRAGLEQQRKINDDWAEEERLRDWYRYVG